jgi:hypothetical protein
MVERIDANREVEKILGLAYLIGTERLDPVDDGRASPWVRNCL